MFLTLIFFVSGLTLTQMYVGPVVIAVVCVSIIFQVFPWFMTPIYIVRALSWLAGLRCINHLLTLLVFTCGCIISNLYHAPDPGFPEPWPTLIRKFTHVYAWQLGPHIWLAGFGMQIFASLLDLWYSQQFINALSQF